MKVIFAILTILATVLCIALLASPASTGQYVVVWTDTDIISSSNVITTDGHSFWNQPTTTVTRVDVFDNVEELAAFLEQRKAYFGQHPGYVGVWYGQKVPITIRAIEHREPVVTEKVTTEYRVQIEKAG